MLVFIVCTLPLFVSSQSLYSQKDIETFNSIISDAEKSHWADSSVSYIIKHTGSQLLGKPYVGGILDKPEREKLVIDFDELDCVTFLENTIALSIIIRDHKTSFDDFCNELKRLRYRGGVMNGYISRLHYFSEWIENNQDMGILENVTQNIGGRIYTKNLNCMSANREKYPRLKEDSTYTSIKNLEERLNTIKKYYIPKDEIDNVGNRILDGDMIAITTTIEGLDIAHVGIAVHMNGRLHLMHASSLNKNVEISELPLYEMLQGKSIWSGIMVARLNN